MCDLLDAAMVHLLQAQQQCTLQQKALLLSFGSFMGDLLAGVGDLVLCVRLSTQQLEHSVAESRWA